MSIDLEEIKGIIRGPTVSVKVPFNDNNELNVEALREYVQFIMDGGITNNEGNILCPGGIGHLMSLSHEENKLAVKTGAEVAGNKLAVVVGVNTCNYREAIELSLNAAEAGAKCVMMTPPFYYPLTQEDIYRWYKVIAEEIGTKIGIQAYDQPWNTYIGGYISLPLMAKLATIESMISIKYSCGVLKDYITALSLYSKRFAFIDNSGTYKTIPAQVHGKAAGYINHDGAFWPEFEAKYWSLLKQGKYEEATKWHTKIDPFENFFRGNIAKGDFYIAIHKAALEYVGLYAGLVRPPFIDISKEKKEKLFGIMEAIGIPKKR